MCKKANNLSVNEWLSNFISNEEIRQKAQDNIIKQKGEQFLSSQIVSKDPLSAFCKLFNFFDTPENKDFWLNFASTLKN